jgi:hypothetical protein
MSRRAAVVRLVVNCAITNPPNFETIPRRTIRLGIDVAAEATSKPQRHSHQCHQNRRAGRLWRTLQPRASVNLAGSSKRTEHRPWARLIVPLSRRLGFRPGQSAPGLLSPTLEAEFPPAARTMEPWHSVLAARAAAHSESPGSDPAAGIMVICSIMMDPGREADLEGDQPGGARAGPSGTKITRSAGLLVR